MTKSAVCGALSKLRREKSRLDHADRQKLELRRAEPERLQLLTRTCALPRLAILNYFANVGADERRRLEDGTGLAA